MTLTELVTHALELMQLALLVIVFSGLYTLRSGEKRQSRSYRAVGPARRLRQPFAWFFLLSVALLISTQGMLPPHFAALSGAFLPSLSVSLAFPTVFALDLLGAAYLVARTGGYSQSPFSPVLIVLPAIAILLRDTPLHFVGYAAGAGLLLTLLLRAPSLQLQANPLHRQASALVTWGCLGLVALMGYSMRLPL